MLFESWQAKEPNDFAAPSETTSDLVDSGTFTLNGLSGSDQALTEAQNLHSLVVCDLLLERGYTSAHNGTSNELLVSASYTDPDGYQYRMSFTVRSGADEDVFEAFEVEVGAAHLSRDPRAHTCYHPDHRR